MAGDHQLGWRERELPATGEQAMTDGLVYYALDATRKTQVLKIGHTTNLAQRMQALRQITMSAQTPIVLAVEEGSITLERARHDQFHEQRHHGEWFLYDGLLQKFLIEMEHPVSYLLDRPYLWPHAGGWASISTAAGQQRWPSAISTPYDGDDEDRPPVRF
jgi:hypothetical protein